MTGKNARSTGEYTSNTSLGSTYKADTISMINRVHEQVFVETWDNNFSTGPLGVNLILATNAPAQAVNAPISERGDFQILIKYPVGGGSRLDTADSGKVTYKYDKDAQTFEATLDFEVNAANGNPGYSFSNGKVTVKGIDPSSKP